MTLNEALSQGLMVSGVGMTIVFSVLVILMIVLMIMKVVFYKEDKKAKPQKVKAPKKAKKADEELAAVIAAAMYASAEPAMTESELIAVLTAAVAASLNTSTYNLKIKSYRRVGNNAPAWNRAGVRETIENRF